MYACPCEISSGFFAEVWRYEYRPFTFRAPPRPLIRKLTLVRIRPRCQSPVLAMVSLNSCSESAGLLR
jgi:hypothetical protein